MTIQQYAMDKYTKKLCDAVEAYDFPAVTYDFNYGIEINRCESDPTHEVKKRRECMREVEKTIGAQLLCEDIDVVKDGLSNVLYWGFATQKGRQIDRVHIFRNKVKDFQINRFKSVVRNLSGPRLASIRGRVNNKNDNMPQFTMMPFVSKVMMFLDPVNFPVLDMKLAEEFSQSESFPPLRYLTFKKKAEFGKKADTSIRITEYNENVYENWASWCLETATKVSSHSNSPCKDLRAVDVERAIYQIAKSDKEEAQRLLQGPKAEH